MPRAALATAAATGLIAGRGGSSCGSSRRVADPAAGSAPGTARRRRPSRGKVFAWTIFGFAAVYFLLPLVASAPAATLAQDSWTPTSTYGAPVARNRHTAVWTGTRMIVWGGNV